MIRKILCFFGFHKWEERIGYCACNGCAWYEDSGLIVCKTCDYCKFCYYCSKPRKKVGGKMKINKTKLKNQTLYLTSDEIKNEAEFIEAMKHCIEKVKCGQSNRIANSLGESWGIKDLEKLVNCIDFKA